LREFCEQMREKCAFVHNIMSRSAVVGCSDQDRGPLQ
jgi:hypothetical protein